MWDKVRETPVLYEWRENMLGEACSSGASRLRLPSIVRVLLEAACYRHERLVDTSYSVGRSAPPVFAIAYMHRLRLFVLSHKLF